MPAKPVMPSKPAPPARPAPTAAPKGKKAALIGLVGLLVGLIAGYGAGRVSTGTPVNPLSTSKGGSYQDGYNAAKKKIDDAHVFPPAPTSATSLSGTVKSVGTGSLVMDVVISSPNPLEELSVPMERTVTLASAAKIQKESPKTPDEFQKEMDAYQKAAAAGGAPAAPPSTMKLVPISLQDLKAGDAVTVTADHDILREAAFSATEIDLSNQNAAPAVAPTLQP